MISALIEAVDAYLESLVLRAVSRYLLGGNMMGYAAVFIGPRSGGGAALKAQIEWQNAAESVTWQDISQQNDPTLAELGIWNVTFQVSTEFRGATDVFAPVLPPQVAEHFLVAFENFDADGAVEITNRVTAIGEADWTALTEYLEHRWPEARAALIGAGTVNENSTRQQVIDAVVEAMKIGQPD